MTVRLLEGDCRALLRTLPAASFDACVCDPPYHLTTGKKGGSGPASLSPNTSAGRARITGFMGRAWDGGTVANEPATWAEVYRVLKPGAYLLAFGGTRTYHRMVCAIEDAGFEIRDCIRHEQDQEAWPAWVYGTGFPKSHNVEKALDRHLGAKGRTMPKGGAVRRIAPGAVQNGTGSWTKLEDRTYQPGEYVPATPEAAAWAGFGTALKPAWEPICVARKPLDGTVAANVLRHGCGALNIGACRVPVDPEIDASQLRTMRSGLRQDTAGQKWGLSKNQCYESQMIRLEGRWPANLIHDGSAAVVAAFPAKAGAFASVRGTEPSGRCKNVYGKMARTAGHFHGDTGSAARFFYSPKANKADRAESNHPTIKPIALMRYLVRLVTPPGGHVLDPFAGSGTTGEAAHLEGFDATLCELTPEYVADIRRRMARAECPITSAVRVALQRSEVTITNLKAAHKQGYVALREST